MYEFSNICLVPRVISTIKSRSDVDTSVKKDLIKMNLPIIASPMRDVCDGKFANKLIEKGCYAIMHRFCTIEEQVSEFLCNKNMAAAIGVNGDYIDRFNALYNAGCRVFCIDVANGATTLVKNITENLSDKFNDVKFIVGNVASKEAYLFVSSLPNVIGVRVGIAGGCFLAGTKVRTINGLKKIESIKIGDKVLTHKGKYKEVIQTFQRKESDRIIDVNGIKCTPNHKFYVVNKEKVEFLNEDNLETVAEWVSAEELSEKYFLIKMQE